MTKVQILPEWRVMQVKGKRFVVLETIQYGPFRRMDELEKFLAERRKLVMEGKT